MSKRNLIVSLLLLLLVGCSSPKRGYEHIESIPMLGTMLNIIADIPADSARSLFRAAMELDKEMKSQMSIFDSLSLISRINRGEECVLTDDIIYNISLADSISRLSDGLYDITVLPLVEAWGFGRKQAQTRPNIDSLLEFVGYEKIAIKEGRLIKQDPRTRLDFNSIAKGYTVDKMAQIVETMGAQNYLVDIGGEIVSRGVNEKGDSWRVGVESPSNGDIVGQELQKIITLSADNPLRGVATSGNYRRFYINDEGQKICHTIDPKTGLSNPSKLLSVTVVASNCALADGYATMFMAAGSDSAMELLDKIEGVEVYFILSGEGDQEYQEFMTAGLSQMVAQ